MHTTQVITRENGFGIGDYWRMFRAKGIRLPIDYFLQAHLFDLVNGTDTHTATIIEGSTVKPLGLQDYERPYRCSWTGEVNKAFAALRQILGRDFERYTFVDIGCGKGKVVLAWTKLLRRAGLDQPMIGIDVHGPCITGAIRNRKIIGAGSDVPGAPSIRFVHADARTFNYGEHGNKLIVYLYNPFSAAILQSVMAALNPIAPVIVYNNPVDLDVMTSFGYRIVWGKEGWHPNARTIILMKGKSLEQEER
ncbi:class I SAM-dependent methyltransferase [Noviherbaspirillum sp. Root189]|uniref:class I SAM-dependent methyltransferase n=1 Tax=Noviherbaspirillum sp. Root189 TaxID=1736487 RepID=UPI0012E3A37A|nr:class I SAM-dependent methyltransferase [Noviherbaspirillum sp. Root189]